MKKLKDLRDEINKLDTQIIKFINQRASLAQEIGKIKRSKKQEIFSPAREEEVYQRIEEENKGPLSQDSIKAIYREIMSGAKALEKELSISYLGPKASYTHSAALNKFGSSVKYLPADTIKDVFLDVEKGGCDYGVVPVENSTEGMVTYTLDMFMESNLKICSEVVLKIMHNLMSKTTDIKKIKKIYSKAQAINQCRNWIKNNLPKAELIEVSSTTKAAEIAKNEKDAAAIGGELAAAEYKLHILKKGIEDSAHNVTRFLVIGQNYSEKTRADKTSLIFLVKDRIGALYEALQPFRKNKINLTKIESRPSKRKAWEYHFFVDMVGHCEDDMVKKALRELEKNCVFVRVLGSYPTMKI